MDFIDTYENLPFVFSGNVSTLELHGIDTGDAAGLPYVDFTVELMDFVPGHPIPVLEHKFSLPAVESVIVLDIREIFSGFSPLLVPGTRSNLKTVTIRAALNEEYAAWSHNVILGECTAYDEERLMNNHKWWTKRPQVSRTYIHGREELSCFMKSSEKAKVCAVLYSCMNPPVTLQIAELINSGSHGKPPYNRIYSIDCSHSGILALAEENGFSDGILAYDIFIEGNEDDAQRFMVRDDDSVSEFRFRNSLGLYDYIYATGSAAENIEHDTKTFINGRKETELANDSRHLFKTNTGYLRSRDETAFWREFLMSDERYVLDDGEWREVIVDETDNECKSMELGEMSFNWHFAEHRPSGIPIRHELKPYILKCNGISEL